MQINFIFFIAADTSHLGRLDYASLSTQALMEILIEGIENREVICGSQETPDDVEQWTGLEYTEEETTDEVETHFDIEWCNLELVGTIDLHWLPQTVDSLDISENKLRGSLNLTALPLSIQWLSFDDNAFSGEIDLCHLPAEIKELFFQTTSSVGHSTFKNCHNHSKHCT